MQRVMILHDGGFYDRELDGGVSEYLKHIGIDPKKRISEKHRPAFGNRGYVLVELSESEILKVNEEFDVLER